MAGAAAFVKAETADRLAEAAQNLMDAARAATTESPAYKPGDPNTAAAVAMAVQAVFMADMWDQPGKAIPLDPDLTIARCRGLGMGVGCAIAATARMETQNLLAAEVMRGMIAGGLQRESVRKETGK